MSEFRGKVVVITGGAGAIGMAIARRMARDDATIVLLDRDASAVEQGVAELRHSGAAAAGYTCDVSQPAECRQAAQTVLEAHQGVDVLVHCAGLTHISRCRETELSVYRRVMEVNFFGAVALTQPLLPSLVQRRGRIVVLSSVAGFAPLVGRSGYCASKHALHGYFNTLRCELAGDGVSVTIVAPSFVATSFAERGLRGDGGERSAPRRTTGRLLTPERVAELVYRGTSRRRRLVLPSLTARLSYWLSRLAPARYDRVMTRRLADG